MIHRPTTRAARQLRFIVILSVGLQVTPLGAGQPLPTDEPEARNFRSPHGPTPAATIVAQAGTGKSAVDSLGTMKWYRADDYFQVSPEKKRPEDWLKGENALRTYGDSPGIWASTDMTALRKNPQFQELLGSLKKLCPNCDVVPSGTAGVPCPTPGPRPLDNPLSFALTSCPEGWGFDVRSRQCRRFAQ
jgi:hypothetical protein